VADLLATFGVAIGIVIVVEEPTPTLIVRSVLVGLSQVISSQLQSALVTWIYISVYLGAWEG